MVLVNGKKFKIYFLDTINSVTSRIALKLNTLPDYLHFSSPLIYLDFEKKDNIIVTDILMMITSSAKKNKSVFKLIDKIKLLLPNMTNKYIKNNIIKIWLAFNVTLQNQYNLGNYKILDPIVKKLVEQKRKYRGYRGCSSHPHNYMLEMLSENGMIGFLFFVTILIIILNKILKIRKYPKSLNQFLVISIGSLLLALMFPFKPSGSFLSTFNASIFFYLGYPIRIVKSMFNKIFKKKKKIEFKKK